MNAPHPLHALVGESEIMARLRARIRHYARVDAPVLIQGPTGTGKELAARALHRLAGEGRPFVAVNCANLPPSLATAQLFGTEPGGFTGAVRRRGCIREAAGGTLFLDEIADLPPEVQGGLLRALEYRTFSPVGGQPIEVAPFRLICASHIDLQARVREGKFRADLLYRIEGLVLRTPALETHLSDLPALVSAFSAQPGRWPEATLTALRKRPWPGNVRQLKHQIAAAELEADFERAGSPVRPRHLPPIATTTHSSAKYAGMTLREIKQRACVDALDHHNGNARAAARALAISPTTLYQHLPTAR
ncbi:MAG: sigma 54-interacting transcriptional regulator [Bradymonadia bacterium]